MSCIRETADLRYRHDALSGVWRPYDGHGRGDPDNSPEAKASRRLIDPTRKQKRTTKNKTALLRLGSAVLRQNGRKCKICLGAEHLNGRIPLKQGQMSGIISLESVCSNGEKEQ